MTLNPLSGLEFRTAKPRTSMSWSLLLLGGLKFSKTNENRKVLWNNKEIVNQTSGDEKVKNYENVAYQANDRTPCVHGGRHVPRLRRQTIDR
jgi:hypothetical protein